jgi:hypothetical protein
MEQKDYILREIEKIGVIINYIRERFFSGKRNQATSMNERIEDMKGILLTETGLDLDWFLSLSVEDSNEYLGGIKGYNFENIEALAGCISDLCLHESTAESKKQLETALRLYELCNIKSKTYSFERENKIEAIKNALYGRS